MTRNAYGGKVVYSVVGNGEGHGSDWLMSTHCNVLCLKKVFETGKEER